MRVPTDTPAVRGRFWLVGLALGVQAFARVALILATLASAINVMRRRRLVSVTLTLDNVLRRRRLVSLTVTLENVLRRRRLVSVTVTLENVLRRRLISVNLTLMTVHWLGTLEAWILFVGINNAIVSLRLVLPAVASAVNGLFRLLILLAVTPRKRRRLWASLVFSAQAPAVVGLRLVRLALLI